MWPKRQKQICTSKFKAPTNDASIIFLRSDHRNMMQFFTHTRSNYIDNLLCNIILSLRKSKNHVRVLVKTKISEWNFDLVRALQVLSLHTSLLRSDKGWRSTVTPIFNRVSFSELKFWIEMLIYCICSWERKLHKWKFWVNILI